MAPTMKMLTAPVVLVVNDNPKELEDLVAGLKIEGCPALGVVNFNQALEALSENNCDVAIIDLMISEMNGLKLARKFKKTHPDLLTMLMSDYLLSPVQLAKADTGVVGFIPKPCCYESLARFIRRKIGSMPLRGEEVSVSADADADADADSLTPFDVHSLQFAI